MACIRKIKGKFRVDINKKGFPRLAKRFLDKKTAMRWAMEIELQMERNEFEGYSSQSGGTLKEILIKYRDEKTVLKKGWREETSVINFLINHKISLHGLSVLRSHHIHKLMKELSVTRKPSTVNKYIVLICHAWRVAKREWGIHLPKDNPCDFVTLNRVKDYRDRILTNEEYEKLLDACDTSNLVILKDIVVFASSTGARQGEILKLKRDHINFEKKEITFYDTKNSEDRTIPVSDNILGMLKTYRFGTHVFNTRARRLRKHFLIACKKAEIENFRFHDLRGFFATKALLSGMNLAQVSFLTGHKDWGMLKRYTRIKPADLLKEVNNIVTFSKKVSG